MSDTPSFAAAVTIAGRGIGRAWRDALGEVRSAVKEGRGVARTLVAAAEWATRAEIAIVRSVAVDLVTAAHRMPAPAKFVATAVRVMAAGLVGCLSLAVSALMALDILLNTVADWTMLHPAVRKRE
jgi:hypothetical protein